MLSCTCDIRSREEFGDEEEPNKHVPSKSSARFTRRSATIFATSNSSSVLYKSSAWKFPSPAWPTRMDGISASARSFFVSYTNSGSFETGTLESDTVSDIATGCITSQKMIAPNIGGPALRTGIQRETDVECVLPIRPHSLRFDRPACKFESSASVFLADNFYDFGHFLQSGIGVSLEFEEQPVLLQVLSLR